MLPRYPGEWGDRLILLGVLGLIALLYAVIQPQRKAA